jgi:8-oxo-dGTP diphosphatase
LANKPTYVPVVAAVIADVGGRLLLQLRPAGKRHAGLWEFPGGKVEAIESPRFALCREVREELGLELDLATLEPAGFAEEEPHDGHPGIVLLLYRCARWRGSPQSLDGQRWGWFTPAEAASLAMPRMDRQLLAGLDRAGAG